MKSVPFARHDIPVLTTSDAVVAGGSCGAVAAAETLARAGWRVALVEPRTYLGREMSATLRPWLPAAADDSLLRRAPLLHAFVLANELAANESGPVTNELPLALKDLKVFLEDRLLAAGVQLFYASLPIAVIHEAIDEPVHGPVRGLVIGNKSGRQLLRCRVLIDATANGLITNLCGAVAPALFAETISIFARTLEFDGVSAIVDSSLRVPAELGMVDNQVLLHRGYRGADHVVVECRLRLPAGDNSGTVSTVAAWGYREQQARRLTTRLAAYLMQEVDAFAGATLAAASHELHGPHAAPSTGPAPAWAQQHNELLIQKSGETATHSVPMNVFAGPSPNLWRLNESAHVSPGLGAAMRDPLVACAVGTQLANHLSRPAPEVQAPAVTGKEIERIPDDGNLPFGGPQIRDAYSPQPGKRYQRMVAEPRALPVLEEVDVLVAGGGTSGATAALVAGRAGLRTALVEMNPGLGGTGTYGGVHSYWFGRRVGFAAHVTDLAIDMHRQLRHPPPEGPVPRWNIEVKAQALRQATEDAGVHLYLNALVFGAIVDGDEVRGVAVATRQGPVALMARVIIDASGDGDVAAHAGARTAYGAARDHVVMWYSLAQFARPGRTRNNFTSMVDVSNLHDYTRAILAGRRRLRDRDHDDGIYVAPRESRHVVGDVELTLSDQLLQRRWLDVINVTFSNHDVKGHSTSDWVRVGLIPPNLEVEIPYGALLPAGLRNILVVGKALSATHDALPAIRMQADMENLGGAAALAAAYACQHDCDLRHIDVAAVQEELIAAGVLPPEIRRRRLIPWRLNGKELARQIASLDARPLISYADMEMDEIYRNRLLPVDVCCAGPQAIPLLEQELARSQGERRLLLAQLLALLGSRASVPVLLEHLQDALAAGALPARSSHIRYAGAPPDQGAMPQEVYLLHALGMARDRRALPVWEQVVGYLATATVEDVESGVRGVFYYVEAVCAGAERLGDAAAIPLLRRLHRYAPFHDLVCRQGFQADFFAERRAYLELLIARALARCGSPLGASVLISYLDDVRALLGSHAHSELLAISGEDLGRETAPWAHWLELQGEALAPKPYCRPTSPRRVWEQEILVAAQAEEPEAAHE